MYNRDIKIQKKITVKLPRTVVYMSLLICISILIVSLNALWALSALLFFGYNQVQLLNMGHFIERSVESYAILSFFVSFGLFGCCFLLRMPHRHQWGNLVNIIGNNGISVVDKNKTKTFYLWENLVSVKRSWHGEWILKFSKKRKVYLYSGVLGVQQLNFINELSKDDFFDKMNPFDKIHLERPDYRNIKFPVDLEMSKMRISPVPIGCFIFVVLLFMWV